VALEAELFPGDGEIPADFAMRMGGDLLGFLAAGIGDDFELVGFV
jgi:hypothetical protein